MLRPAFSLVLSLAALQTGGQATPDASIENFDDPYAAYQAGAFDQALQGFMDQQVEHPEDPAVALNVGSSHYQMRNFAAADRLFGKASLSTQPELQAEALYNLGNSSFRQGRLQEAVELYKAALEMNPDDEDAKFNLEFVRDEIRRRHEEAQKRQQEQQQNQQQDQNEDQQGEPKQGEEQNQESEQSQQDSEQQTDEPPQAGGQDSDQDGLPDRVEEQGENPTDPKNPDSDGDGLPDGAEDLNRSGSVDPEETDPNNPDTDGDGIPDAQEAMSSAPQDDARAQEAEGGLTPEEADRYLQAVEEGQPDRGRRRSGNRRRNEKDW